VEGGRTDGIRRRGEHPPAARRARPPRRFTVPVTATWLSLNGTVPIMPRNGRQRVGVMTKLGTKSGAPSRTSNCKEITVSHVDLVYSATGHRPIEYRCHWCDGDAFFVVARTSTLTGTRYADYACTPCAQKWITPTAEDRSERARRQRRREKPGHTEQRIERMSESHKRHWESLTPDQRRERMAPAIRSVRQYWQRIAPEERRRRMAALRRKGRKRGED